jgi:hypothetical protein
MAQRKKEMLSRKGFLKTVGAGTAGAALLGAPAALWGCESRDGKERKVGTERRVGTEQPGPNVILIIIDTLRKDHVGAYGNDWIKTPNLDALAGESLLFTRPPGGHAHHTRQAGHPHRDEDLARRPGRTDSGGRRSLRSRLRSPRY